MSRRAPVIELSPEETQQLERTDRARSSSQAAAFRARIILRCAAPDHPPNWQIALELGCEADTVCKWRRRFAERRLDGLGDLPRSGAPRVFSPRRPP